MSQAATNTSPRAGDVFHLFGGDIVTIKLATSDTGGAFTLLDTVTPPGAGPPPHRHQREDEYFYVVAGEFEFHRDGQLLRVRAGEVVTAPRGSAHWFRNVSDEPGRLLITCAPAGFEHFVAEFAHLSPTAPPEVDRMRDIGARHGIEFLPAPSD